MQYCQTKPLVQVSTVEGVGFVVNPKKLETGLRTISAGIPYI